MCWAEYLKVEASNGDLAGCDYETPQQPGPSRAATSGSSGGRSFGQFSAASANQFIRQITDAEGRPVFQCTLCNKTSGYKGNLQRHMVIKHTKSSSYSCQYCQKVFANKFYLSNHISTKTCMRNIMFDPE